MNVQSRAECQVRVTELMGRDMPATEKARAALRAVHDSCVHPWTVRADIRCVLRALDDKPPTRETIMKTVKGVTRWIERRWQRRGRGARA